MQLEIYIYIYIYIYYPVIKKFPKTHFLSKLLHLPQNLLALITAVTCKHQAPQVGRKPFFRTIKNEIGRGEHEKEGLRKQGDRIRCCLGSLDSRHIFIGQNVPTRKENSYLKTVYLYQKADKVQ